MSTQIVTVEVDFSTDNADDCGSRLLSVPSDQVEAGDALEFRLSGSLEDIDGFFLTAGTESLGVGELCEIVVDIAGEANSTEEVRAFAQQVDFEENFTAQLDYPVDSIYFVEALTEILSLDSSGKPYRRIAKGTSCADFFQRKGGSCIRAKEGIPLYGSIEVTAFRPRYYRKWSWTVPANSYGDQWFFLYYQGDVYKKFAIALPDLATASGAANITIRPIDESSEAVIEGAEVYLDGKLMGTTDAAGLKLSSIAAGTHVLRIIASGYLDTDADELSNDTIVVS